jgi:O-antigen/teichoic acid export membrane protein
VLASRIKQLSKDSLIYGIGGALARSIGIILVPLYTHYFATDQYGIYGNVVSVATLITTLLIFGLDAATSIYFFDSDAPDTRREVTAVWLYATLIVSIPICVLLLPLSGLLSNLAGPNDSYAGWVALAVVNVPFVLLSTVFVNVLRLYFQARAYVAVTLFTAALNLALTVWMVAVLHWGIPGTLIASLISSIAGSIPGLILTRHYYALRLNRELLGKMLRIGWPMMLASLALVLNNTANGFFLLHLISANETGVFSIALRITALASVLMTAFQLAWSPYSLSIASAPDAKRTYAKVLTYYIIGFGGFALALGLFGREILTLVDSRHLGYAEGYKVLGLLAYATILTGAYYITNIGSNIAKKTTNISWTTMAAAATNIVLNLALIPWLGMVGSALASLSVSLLTAWLIYRVSQREYPIPFEMGKVGLTIALGLALMALGLAVDSGQWWLDALIKLGILVVYVFTLPLLGIITSRELSIAQGAVMRRLRRQRTEI